MKKLVSLLSIFVSFNANAQNIDNLQDLAEATGGIVRTISVDDNPSEVAFNMYLDTHRNKIIEQGTDKWNKDDITLNALWIDSEVSGARLGIYWDNSKGDLDLVLWSPDGEYFDKDTKSDKVVYNKHEGQAYYELTVPKKGSWGLGVVGSKDSDKQQNNTEFTYYAIGNVQQNLNLELLKSVFSDNLLIIKCIATGKENLPITKGKARAFITEPNGNINKISLFDDGQHQDGEANDGIYANIYSYKESGIYKMKAQFKGTALMKDVMYRQTRIEQIELD